MRTVATFVLVCPILFAVASSLGSTPQPPQVGRPFSRTTPP